MHRKAGKRFQNGVTNIFDPQSVVVEDVHVVVVGRYYYGSRCCAIYFCLTSHPIAFTNTTDQ